MLAIQKARAGLLRIPRLSVIGIGLMVVAGVADVTVHLLTTGHHHSEAAWAHGAHLLGIAGMVLVLAGLIAFGARRTSGRRSGSNMEGPRDAHR